MQFRTVAVSVIFCWMLFATACGKSAQSYIVRGNEFFQAGKYEDATLNYRKALQQDPKSGEAHYRLGLTQLRQAQVFDAFKSLKQAVELQPDNVHAAVTLADIALTAYIDDTNRPQHLYNLITSLSDRLLSKNPNSTDALRLKGYMAVMDKKPAEGIDLFRKANTIKPMQPEVVLPLVQALLQEKQFQEAEKWGEALIQTQRTFARMYDILAQHYMAVKRPAEAERVLKAKIENNPKVPENLIDLVRHYTKTGQETAANSVIRRLLDNPTDYPHGRALAGDFYANVGKADEALRLFEEGAKADSRNAPAYQIRIATVLKAQGKVDESLKILNAVLQQQPGTEDAAAMRGNLLLDSGKPENIDAALAGLQQAVKLRPSSAILRFSLGRAYVAKGNLQGGREELLAAISLHRSFLGPRLLLAEVSLMTGQNEEALRYADQILSVESSPAVRLVRCRALRALNRMNDARIELTDLLREKPDMIDAQLQMGLLNLEQKRYEEATQIFETLQKPGQNDLRALEGLVKTRIAQNQLDEALRLVQSEYQKSPSSALQAILANLSLMAGKYDLALEHYQVLAAKSPNSAALQSQLGDAYYGKGDLNRALVTYDRSRQLQPNNAAAHARVASALESLGKSEDAIASYRRSLEIRPNNPSVCNNLALLLADRGKDLDEALALARIAQEKLPSNPMVADTVGWIYYKKGLLEPALQVFANLTAKHPGNPTYHLHFASVLLAKGDKTKAREQLQNALNSKPSKIEEQQIKQLMNQIA
jgi:tetratricopeptide (TPR) repeat protein